VRIDWLTRRWLVNREKQLGELLVFLGKLTFKANHFVDPDGNVCRDSQSLPSKVRPKGQKKTRKPKHPVLRSRIGKGKVQSDWIVAWQVHCRQAFSSGSSGCGRAPGRKPRTSLSSRQEIAFQYWWRESRSQSLQPRSSNAPSASQRFEALKERVSSRAKLKQGV